MSIPTSAMLIYAAVTMIRGISSRCCTAREGQIIFLIMAAELVLGFPGVEDSTNAFHGGVCGQLCT
jgi:hypothetical protein